MNNSVDLQGIQSNDEEALKRLDKTIELGYERLIDPKNFDKKYKAAQEYRKGLSNREILDLRKLCKSSLFFLSKTILGYDRLSKYLHGHFCRWIELNTNEKYKQELLPRGHFKSTIETISNTIRKILPADEELEEQFKWPYNQAADIRILICHEVETMAHGYLYSVTGHFLGNKFIMGLFPELIPNSRDQKINKSELELPRDRIWNEPTVGTMGVGGRSQGLHYDDFIFDDITGEKARDSEAENNRVKTWFDSTPGFRTKLKDSPFTVVGTRWGPEDIYNHIEERYGKSLKTYRRQVEEKDEHGNLVPIFPEEIDSEALEVLKKNKKVFAAQYKNDPEGGDTRLDTTKIRYFKREGDSGIVIREKIGDKNLPTERLNVWNLYRCMLLDPSVGGPGGYVITGTDTINRNFFLEAKMLEYSPPQWMGLIFEKAREYQLHAVAIEEVLFSELYRHWAETEMKLRNQYINIVPVKTKQQAKTVRVDGLANYLSSGQIFLLHDAPDTVYTYGQDKIHNDSDILYQFKKYGVIKEYHTLDAAAYGKDVWRPGFNLDIRRKQEEEAKNRILSNVSHAGYSKVNYKR